MFVVARKVARGDAKKATAWQFWTGSSWTADRSQARTFPAREGEGGALAAHAELLASQQWPVGGNPLVVEKD